MHISRYSASILIAMLYGILTASNLLIADDNIMPPPEVSEQHSSLDQPIEKSDSAPDLRNALMPDDDHAVNIRSYQRKDGTMVTEYGAKGQVFRLKIQPPGGFPAYYLERNANGNFERRLTGSSTRVTPPSWVLQEF